MKNEDIYQPQADSLKVDSFLNLMDRNNLLDKMGRVRDPTPAVPYKEISRFFGRCILNKTIGINNSAGSTIKLSNLEL